MNFAYREIIDLLLANPVLKPEQKRLIIQLKNRKKLSKLNKGMLRAMYKHPVRLEVVK